MRVSSESTFGGESLYLMQIGHFHKNIESNEFRPPKTPKIPTKRPKLLLSFGEHAREFVTVESFFHLLEYILAGVKSADQDCAVMASQVGEDGLPVDASDGVRLVHSPGYRARWSRFVLDHVDLHLLGVTNPDGRMHIEAGEANGKADYCWRNTGRGVDLNRNGAWEFDGPGSSSRPGHEEYHGAAPFSETETRFIRDLQEEYKYASYVSVHSGEQQLFVPFVDTRSKSTNRRRPSTDLELAICNEVVQSKKLNRWLHDSGIGYEMNDYSADGTLMDSMAGISGIPLVFCVELWGGPIHDDCFVQFNPDPKEIDYPGVAGGAPFKQTGLAHDLRRMHVFYIELFQSLIFNEYGVRYQDPIEIAEPEQRERALKRMETICRIEQDLYAYQSQGTQSDAQQA